MLCSISGEIPQTPVISIKSGHVYEKTLIEKYLNENDNKEPITNQVISLEDLLQVNQAKSVAPRPPTLSSIPSLLSVFQNEWDSLMLEMFTLKQQYQQVRQQLSHALYQNDASARVIARLIKERDEARRALSDLKETIGTQSYEAQNNGAPEETGLTDEIIENIETNSQELKKGRKKRVLPEGLSSPEDISSFGKIKAVSSLHSKEKLGINSLQILKNFAATGGNDGRIQIYDFEEDTIVAGFDAHQNGVKSLIWDSETTRIFSISDDFTTRCWNPKAQDDFSSWSLAGELCGHTDVITSFSLNPLRQYAATTSLDKTWKFLDVHNGQVISTFVNPDGAGYSCGSFHPDGALFAAGTTDSVVQIWSIKEKTKLADFPGHTGAITSISFSENGYFLATTSEDNDVKIWDLRKSTNIETITFETEVNKAIFDPSGSYLAAKSKDMVNVYKAKSWKDPLVSLDIQADDFQFDTLSKHILTVSSSDSGMHVFGVSE